MSDDETNATDSLSPQPQLPEESSAKKTGKVEKTTKKLQSAYALPYASPKVLADILKAYVIASSQGAEPITYKDVAAVANRHPTDVSRNNAFLAESGFITSERRGYFKPAPETNEFAKQAPWDDEGAKRHIRTLIDKTWYGELLQQKFQMRNSQSKQDLIKAFGMKATPDPSDASRLDLLLDFLVYFDYLQLDEQGNYFRPQQETETPGSLRVRVTDAIDSMVKGVPVSVAVDRLIGETPETTRSEFLVPRINVNINLTASTTDEELAGLISKVRTLLEMLRHEEKQ
jgi:predicted transcriptional regulator